MLLASRAMPQITGVNSSMEKEIEKIVDKERKKRMEELWKAYNEKNTNGILSYLPPGK